MPKNLCLSYALKGNKDLSRLYARKIEITHGRRTGKYTASELCDLLYISKQHAYRLIADPSKLSKIHYELLIYKDMRALPGWDPGWYVQSDGLRAPNNHVITQHDMEYNSCTRSYISTLQKKNEDQTKQIDNLNIQLKFISDRLEDAYRRLADSKPRKLQSGTKTSSKLVNISDYPRK